MVVSLRKWRKWFQFFTLFFTLTIVPYWLLALLIPYLVPHPLHQEPLGDAVKVFAEPIETEISASMDMEEMKQRLFLFFWYGE